VERANDPAKVRDIWRGLAGQGVTKLGFDPDEGGLREILLVFEELGRASCPAPLLGAVIVSLLARERRNSADALARLAEALHGGTAAAAIAFGAADGDGAAGSPAFTGEAVSGRAAFVEDGAVASHYVLFTATPPGVAIVDAGAAGMNVTPTPGLAVPPLSELSLSGVKAQRVEVTPARLGELAQVARLCTAARALGAAQRGFELALDHAKMRRQFGQLIGQFQAIQHKLADCLTRLDGARLTLDAAATLFDRGMPDWRIFAAASLAYAGPALRQVVLESHHTMGAIGYAEEHEMPRHFRRIHADLARFGGAPRARAELADYLLGPAAATGGTP
ncbi:MAG TPA: acyl-CoA dehydrogenase family protein, partial [Stellaceae bacterium]|nr:acyl-CoA dehydrogenase family protein [Stellaceae bacterium]